MSSITCKMKELWVLLDLLRIMRVNNSCLNDTEYIQIRNSLIDNGYLKENIDGFIPAKGLSLYLKPIAENKQTVFLKYGTENNTLFNCSLYFAKSGVTAIIRRRDDEVSVLKIESAVDLIMLIDRIDMVKEYGYISYFINDVGLSDIRHFTFLDSKKNKAITKEEKHMVDGQILQAEHEFLLNEYREQLSIKFGGLFDVACN